MNQDYPNIVVIKRTGADGPKFPLRQNVYLFGRLWQLKLSLSFLLFLSCKEL